MTLPSRVPRSAFRILGIDPSLRSTGYAVIETNGSEFRAIDYGLIQNKPTIAPSRCLAAIHETLDCVIREHRPAQAALEAIIFAQNLKTAITMGHARGAAVLACARHDLEIYEYSPKKVKMGVSGKGSGAKHQVSFMVRALLGLSENPPFDVTDALAVALTHAQQNKMLSEGKQI
jgi:crossover junction endodeoxyribonuclease RuvC